MADDDGWHGRGRWLAAAAALPLVLALGACGVAEEDAAAEATPDLGEFYDQRLDWRDCDRGDGVQCAAFEVPVDYADPDGPRLEIAALRLPASGADPQGSLVVNPGGPGGSGLDYAAQARRGISAEVRERFHVVGFDPRGVGESAPIRCLDTEGLDDYFGVELHTGDSGRLTDDQVAALREANAEFAAACQQHAGDLLAHLGTANVARDMDVLRQALGEERLTYLGKSYGTYLGAHYAALFGDRLRAAVLDGAMDPTLSGLQLGAQQAEGFHIALEAFVADCMPRADCPLGAEGGDADDGVARLQALLDDAAAEPLDNRLGDGREVNSARAGLGLLAALYNEASWPAVRDALTAAFAGDGTALLQLGDRLYGRHPDGDYVNATAARTAVNCLDRPVTASVGDYQRASAQAVEESPVFGASLVWSSFVCSDWPVSDSGERPEDFSAGEAGPILVIGTERDPATPYTWAEELSEELDSGVLLGYDGDGHTAYGFGSPCVDDTVDAYLLSLEVPDDGTVCPAAGG